MSAAAHFIALLFAVSAGILSYLILSMPEHPRLGMEHLLVVVLLFSFPIIGMPEIAGGTVLYYSGGFALTRAIYRRRHRQRPSPEPPQPKRESSGTTKKRTPIIFERQRDDS